MKLAPRKKGRKKNLLDDRFEGKGGGRGKGRKWWGRRKKRQKEGGGRGCINHIRHEELGGGMNQGGWRICWKRKLGGTGCQKGREAKKISGRG